MKNRRKHRGSDEDSSEDEHIIDFEAVEEEVEEEVMEEDVFNSEQMQIIEKRSEQVEEETKSKSKKKKRKKDKKSRDSDKGEEDEMVTPKASINGDKRKYDEYEDTHAFQKPSLSKSYDGLNGYRVRELDVSEIPGNIISDMMRIVPQQLEEDILTVEAVENAATSSKGGVWILKCPKDVQLRDILLGQKLYLDGGGSIFKTEDYDEDENAQLPTDSLGFNVKDRRFEATSLPNDEFKDGALLLLPEEKTFKLVAAPIQGHIVIRESVKDLELPEIKVPRAPPRQLPLGIKERHPVYGSNFSKIIKEMETTNKKERKSNQNDSSSYSNGHIPPQVEIKSDEGIRSSKKKKKKKDRKEEDEVDSGFGNEYDQTYPMTQETNDDNHRSSKKSKKRKREDLDESYDDLNIAILSEGNEPPTKKKKSKHRM